MADPAPSTDSKHARVVAATAATPPAPTWQAPGTLDELYARATAGNPWGNVNADKAGPRTPGEVTSTRAEVDLYALGTPNGQKVAIFLEELAVEYAAHRVDISKGEQFTEGFTRVNPNGKIPAIVHHGADGSSTRVFESGAILIYLAEVKGSKLLPPVGDPKRAECLSWVMWQMGGLGPMVGQFGHFWKYAPRTLLQALDYGVARYGMETRRLLSVLDKHLGDGRQWVLGDEYSIADIIIYPWVACISNPKGYNASDFIGLSSGRFPNVSRWVDRVGARPAVQRGMQVF